MDEPAVEDMEGWMPSLEHTDLRTWENVYEPAEDSYLLMDALYKDREMIYAVDPLMLCEIGVGSGVVSVYLNHLLYSKYKKRLFYQTAIDINQNALHLSKETAMHNNSSFDLICADLFSSFSSTPFFDIIIFNPPYVTTPDHPPPPYLKNQPSIISSWAGGPRGRLLIDRLLHFSSKFLSRLTQNALFYLLLSDENDPHQVIHLLHSLDFKVPAFILLF